MIAVVDSGLANLTSVLSALHRIGVDAVTTEDRTVLEKADRVILPGVGAAEAAMQALYAKNLDQTIKKLTCPVLGICLGMQLLFDSSEEGENPVPCLGVIPGAIKKLTVANDLTIPHMGWNQIYRATANVPLLEGIDDGAFVYFVHSYAAMLGDYTLASANYGQDFTAIAGQSNFFGCQFHPERSGDVGEKILRNFMKV